MCNEEVGTHEGGVNLSDVLVAHIQDIALYKICNTTTILVNIKTAFHLIQRLTVKCTLAVGYKGFWDSF